MKQAIQILKVFGPVTTIIGFIVGIGIWIGTLQSTTSANARGVNKLESDLELHKREQDQFVKDTYLFMGDIKRDIAVIKTRLPERRNHSER